MNVWINDFSFIKRANCGYSPTIFDSKFWT